MISMLVGVINFTHVKIRHNYFLNTAIFQEVFDFEMNNPKKRRCHIRPQTVPDTQRR